MIPDSWCSNRRHGDTKAAYDSGCRCTVARVAVAAYQRGLWADHKAGQRRLVDATGTTRRLCALHAIGWTTDQLAQICGVTEDAVRFWRNRSVVNRATADRVVDLYERLHNVPGSSVMSRQRSEARGWLPPAWWVGVDLDDPAAVPVDPCRLSRLDAFLLVEPDVDDELRAFEAALDVIDADDEAWFEARADSFSWRCWDWVEAA